MQSFTHGVLLYELRDVAERGQLGELLHASGLLRGQSLHSGRGSVSDDTLHSSQQVVKLELVRRLAAINTMS